VLGWHHERTRQEGAHHMTALHLQIIFTIIAVIMTVINVAIIIEYKRMRRNIMQDRMLHLKRWRQWQ
jgi:hypothetical protein